MTLSSGPANHTGSEHEPVNRTDTAADVSTEGGLTGPAPPEAGSSLPDPRRRPGGSSWRVPAALVALTIIPVIAGSLRLREIAGGPVVLPNNPRIDASPAPVVVHIIAAIIFALLGAFQFSTRLRRRRPNWHRRSGRLLVIAGLCVAGSGLWMTLFYADAPGGYLLYAVRLVVGSAMAVSIVLAFTAIRRRDIPTHRAWMMRAYALATGAGTQAIIQAFSEPAFGTSDLPKALSMTAGWLINIAVAEWIIRRPARRRRDRARSAQARVAVVKSP